MVNPGKTLAIIILAKKKIKHIYMLIPYQKSAEYLDISIAKKLNSQKLSKSLPNQDNSVQKSSN